MPTSIKLTTSGNSTVLILPQEILDHLNAQAGDSLFTIETPNGIELTTADPEFTRQMAVDEQVMREDAEALNLLAQ